MCFDELSEAGVIVEEYGGDVPLVPVSARTKTGIDDLLDMILLVADLQELTANPKRAAVGTIVEAQLDKGRGPVATYPAQISRPLMASPAWLKISGGGRPPGLARSRRRPSRASQVCSL